MLLKQTTESPDRKAVLYPGGKNSAVQLGSFREMVFNHKTDRKMAFRYRWTMGERGEIRDPLTSRSFPFDTIGFEGAVGFDESTETIFVEKFHYDLLLGPDTSASVSMARSRSGASKYQVDAEKYVLKRNIGRAWEIRSPVRFYGFPDEVVAYYQNADFVQTLNLEQEKLFRSLFYLGPLRTKPERLYSWSGTEPESVGGSGDYAVAAILAARNRTFNFKLKERRHPFEEVVASKLKDLGLIEDFQLKRISGQRQEYEVRLRIRGSSEWVGLPDVGFGISQVLPVIVQGFYAPRESVILMEQPEIHLHPGAQSALADVMIDMIRSREEGRDRNIQLIVETHSEHLLRRLQRRIAEGTLNQADVAVYFADVSEGPARLTPLRIDEYGSIANWPEHFFGDEMGDILGQAEAAMRRRMQAAARTGAPE
jgi:hypothetical protein